MGFELGGFSTTYSLMQLLSVQRSNLCLDRAQCSVSFWVFLKAPCKAELIHLCNYFWDILTKDIFLVQQEKEVILGAEFLCNIFHNITKKQPSPSAHAHITEKPKQSRSGSLAAPGGCPRGMVALTPWSITRMLQTAAKLQLKAAERFSRSHLGRPPNSLVSAVTPRVFASEQSWQGDTKKLSTAPKGWQAPSEVWSKKSLQSDCKECKALLDSSGWMTNKWQQWSY